MQSNDQIAQAWTAHRPYLIDLAFRMLGDIGAAEDVVQEAFFRLVQTARWRRRRTRLVDRRDQPPLSRPHKVGAVAPRTPR